MKISALILTYNESLHLARCIENVKKITSNILIVDSYSSDSTLEIAQNYGIRLLQHKWENHSKQFNWGLSRLDSDTDWVLRIDADETLNPDLITEINSKLPNINSNIDGIYVKRGISFHGKVIRFGGVLPINVIRLFRYKKGICENRWMDEHIIVSGETLNFKGSIIDDNLKNLTWWTQKHNLYSNRMAVDLLNLEYAFMSNDSFSKISVMNKPNFKRWIMENVYSRLPLGFRPLVYFLYRYIIRLGFLDGYRGAMFHFLQGFWYRFLIDSKTYEVKRYMKKNDVSVQVAISDVLGIEV